jgi:hypothetical protein
LLRRVFICGAYSAWCFSNTWGELAQGDWAYFSRHHPAGVTIPAVLCWQALIFAVLLAAWTLYSPRRLTSTAGAQAAFALLCIAPLGSASVALLRAAPFDLTPVVRHRAFWPVALSCAAVAAAWTIRKGPQAASRMTRSVLLYSWGLLAVLLAQAGWSAFVRNPPSGYEESPLATRLPAGPNPPARVVWIVFDELSQAVTFARRPRTLDLPNFDRLRSESLHASSARAPADATLQSIPALLLGEQISSARPRGFDSLTLRSPSRAAGFDFKSAENIFDRARRLGRNSALSGWFHPYGRLFNRSLVASTWTAGWLLAGVEEPAEPMGFGGLLWHRARAQAAVFPLLGHLPGMIPAAYQREEMAARFVRLLSSSKAYASGADLGLVFLHLPVPHPPGIYDRATLALTSRGSHGYLDNVALADRALGEIREAMERAEVWDRTAVIVSADHGWRPIWRGSPDWSEEEEREFPANGGDALSVPFLVKLPGGAGAAVDYERPFETVRTGGLVLKILRGEIASYTALADEMAETAPPHATN